MTEMTQSVRAVRFGAFEADLQARELRKSGLRVKLEEKPFQILELLLQRAGKVATRKELREKLWPNSFVDFDRNLNTAVSTLRHVLGDLADDPRFVETRSRLGYRFIAPVEIAGTAAPLTHQVCEAIDSIAVLPFQQPGIDPEIEYVADGITDYVINVLSQLPGVRVITWMTAFRYRGRGIDPQAVGRDLNVRTLLMGRVAESSHTLSVATELVDVNNGWRLWGEQYNREFSDIFEVQREVSNAIAESLRSHLARKNNRLVAYRPRERDAVALAR